MGITSKQIIYRKIWEQYSKPLVIKPTGLTAGKGVTVGINSIEEQNRRMMMHY